MKSDSKGYDYNNRVDVINGEDDEDDFATFTISYGHREEKSKNKTPGKWIKTGQSISIKGIEIVGGNFYFGGQLDSLNGYETEASLVDDSLKILDQPVSYEDESLGYWPKYISISAKCRGAYINWLASKRDNINTPIGYIFIYFYGFERRIVVDSIKGSVDDSEFKSIFDELLRLKEIYSESYSFTNYITRLLEFMCILRPNVVSNFELEENPQYDSILFKYRLAKTVKDGVPISAKIALVWLKVYSEYSLRTPARRCSDEFGQMFNSLYKNKYGEGILVKPNKTRLEISYWPASSSLRGLDIPQEDLPDPSHLKGPTNKLVAIADECTDALDAYSRYLGKQDTSREDIAAVLLLPEELINLSGNKSLNEFKNWAEEVLSTSDGLVEVSEFWKFTQTPLPAKINKKESELIQLLAERAGFGVVPDTRYHHAKQSTDGRIVIFREGHGKHFEPSKVFNEKGMIIRLGAMVATIDGYVDQAETSLLKQIIDHDTNLSPVEKWSLHSYLVWRMNTPSNVNGLKAQLEKLGSQEKSAISQILIRVALADGKIDPEEVKQIEKLYTLLGLDKSMVSGDIHGLTTNISGSGNTTTKKSGNDIAGDFSLDENVLAIHELQTKDVQSMLGDIFIENETEEILDTMVEEKSIQMNLGIDNQHYTLYENLISKDNWSREEMEKLCKKHGLMTSGAIETINDWSFEQVDAPVLNEESDSVFVDQDIVLELEN